MQYKELLEKMEKAGLIEQNDYNITIDLYINNNSFENSIVVADKNSVEKKVPATTIDCYALRYAAMNLCYQGDLLQDLNDDKNNMQDNALRLEDFEGYPIDVFFGNTVYVDSLFIGTNNKIYCEVWVDPNNYLLVQLT